jgi:hypothetical protein
MAGSYQTFQKFNDPDLAGVIARKLRELNIPSQVVDENPNFNPSFVNNVVEPTIHLKVRSGDFDRAHQALEEYYRQQLNDVDPDYYLFSFSDTELLDIVAKPDEWGHFDYALAKKLLADRGLTITPATAEELKQQRLKELALPERAHTGWIIAGYICAILGGFFGLIIGYVFAYTKKTLPNGGTVYVYPDQARHHGKRIFFIGILGAAFWLVLRIMDFSR